MKAKKLSIAALLIAVRMCRNFIKVNDKILEVVSDGNELTKMLNITSGYAVWQIDSGMRLQRMIQGCREYGVQASEFIDIGDAF